MTSSPSLSLSLSRPFTCSALTRDHSHLTRHVIIVGCDAIALFHREGCGGGGGLGLVTNGRTKDHLESKSQPNPEA